MIALTEWIGLERSGSSCVKLFTQGANGEGMAEKQTHSMMIDHRIDSVQN